MSKINILKLIGLFGCIYSFIRLLTALGFIISQYLFIDGSTNLIDILQANNVISHSIIASLSFYTITLIASFIIYIISKIKAVTMDYDDSSIRPIIGGSLLIIGLMHLSTVYTTYQTQFLELLNMYKAPIYNQGVRADTFTELTFMLSSIFIGILLLIKSKFDALSLKIISLFGLFYSGILLLTSTLDLLNDNHYKGYMPPRFVNIFTVYGRDYQTPVYIDLTLFLLLFVFLLVIFLTKKSHHLMTLSTKIAGILLTTTGIINSVNLYILQDMYTYEKRMNYKEAWVQLRMMRLIDALPILSTIIIGFILILITHFIQRRHINKR